MKTLKDISEGFYTNTGSGKEASKEEIIKILVSKGLQERFITFDDKMNVVYTSKLILSRIKDISISDFFEGIKIISADNIEIYACPNITDLEGCPQICKGTLGVADNKSLTSLKGISKSIEQALHISGCNAIKHIDYLPSGISKLEIYRCSNLRTMIDIPDTKNLFEIDVRICKNFIDFQKLIIQEDIKSSKYSLTLKYKAL